MGLKLGIIREGGFLLQYLFEPVLLEAAIFDFSFLKKKKAKKEFVLSPKYFQCSAEGVRRREGVIPLTVLVLLSAWICNCPTSPWKVNLCWHPSCRVFFTFGIQQLVHVLSVSIASVACCTQPCACSRRTRCAAVAGPDFPPVCSLFCYFQLCHVPSLFFGSTFASVLQRFEWLYRVQAGGKCCFCSVLHLKWDTNQHPHGLLSVNLLLSDELRRSLPIAKLLWIMLRMLQVFSLLKIALLFLCGWMLACVEQYRIPMLRLKARAQEVLGELIFVVNASDSHGDKKNAKWCVKDLKEKGGLGLGAGPLCCSALHLAALVYGAAQGLFLSTVLKK